MFDETALRLPGFTEGASVVLADGQAWTLPRPVIRLVPAANAIGWRVILPVGDGEAYRLLYDAYDAAETGSERVGNVAQMARLLILANYGLTDDQVADLIQFGFTDADPEGRRIFDEVSDIALGNGPKPSGGGDE